MSPNNEDKKINDGKLLVSIIVPVYMVEEYLGQCIESVLNQTYTNLEIILVDDGSTDGSPKICDEYAERDNRIVVIHKKNGGLSDARNAGLDIMTGDLVFFLDSDDWIEPNTIEIMVNSYNEENVDMVCCGVKNIYEDHTDRFCGNITCILNRDEAVRDIVYDTQSISVIACNKLYKKTLFDKNRYPIGKIHEDEYIIQRIIVLCDKVYCLRDMLYNYRRRDIGSITSDNQSEFSRICNIEAKLDRLIVFRKYGYREYAHKILCGVVFGCYEFFQEKGLKGIEENDILRNIILNVAKEADIGILNGHNYTFFWRLKILIKAIILRILFIRYMLQG